MDWLHRDIFNPEKGIGAVLYGVIIFAAASAVARLLATWSRQLRTRPGLAIDQTAVSFLGRLLQVFCFLLAVILYAHVIPALRQFGSAMLASAGVVSLVIGLAAQNTLGQIIAGLPLLLYRPFAIGDILVISAPTGKETGTVREFTLGYTMLETADGRWLVVPNSVMAGSVLVREKPEAKKNAELK
jgi:small-conductance mechanosensitive channel